MDKKVKNQNSVFFLGFSLALPSEVLLWTVARALTASSILEINCTNVEHSLCCTKLTMQNWWLRI